MPSALITGGNRGLGLAWVRELAAEGWRVYATCRHPAEADALHELSRGHGDVTVMRLDVTSTDDAYAVRRALGDTPLDLLINNAGTYLEKGEVALGRLRFDDWLHTFAVNTLGAARITEALVDNVLRSERRQVVFTTSHMGSIADIGWPGDYYYRSSKAALNALARGLAEELRPRGVTLCLLHPGAVATRMGGPESSLTPETSVRAMHGLIDRLTLKESGRFFRFSGEVLPW